MPSCGLAAEQSSSAGTLMADELQLGNSGVTIVFGCETKETGEIFNQEADGILGLGNSDVAIVNQVRTLSCTHWEPVPPAELQAPAVPPASALSCFVLVQKQASHAYRQDL